MNQKINKNKKWAALSEKIRNHWKKVEGLGLNVEIVQMESVDELGERLRYQDYSQKRN